MSSGSDACMVITILTERQRSLKLHPAVYYYLASVGPLNKKGFILQLTMHESLLLAPLLQLPYATIRCR
jgi:hypothetical protein